MGCGMMTQADHISLFTSSGLLYWYSVPDHQPCGSFGRGIQISNTLQAVLPSVGQTADS